MAHSKHSHLYSCYLLLINAYYKIRSRYQIALLGLAMGMIFSVFIISPATRAQSTHMASRNLGLGGGGAAYMDTYHSNFINPANLSLNNRRYPAFTIGLFGVGASAGGPLANVGVYNKYMTKGKLLNNIADKMYDTWFGPKITDAQSFGADFNAVPIGMVYRLNNWSLSFAYRARSLTDVKANRGTAEFLTFLLNQERFGDPEPINFEVNSVSLSEYSFGISTKIWEGDVHFLSGNETIPLRLHLGFAPKILVGHNSMSIDFNSQIHVRDASIVHDFGYTIKTAGRVSQQLRSYYRDRQVKGQEVNFTDYIKPSDEKFTSARSTNLGLDVGVTAEFDFSDLESADWGSFFEGPKFARIALSLTDVGSISMDKGIGVFSARERFEWNGFEDLRNEERINSEFDSSRSKYIEHVTDSIKNNVYLNYSPEDVNEITTQLPTVLHIGTQIQMGRAGLMIDLIKGFQEVGMNRRQTSAAIGLEYDIFEYWPIRIGFRTGGLGATSYSLGTGLEFKNFELSFSAISVTNSTSGGYYLGAAMSGIVLHF